jgi:hypothetical protein
LQQGTLARAITGQPSWPAKSRGLDTLSQACRLPGRPDWVPASSKMSSQLCDPGEQGGACSRRQKACLQTTLSAGKSNEAFRQSSPIARTKFSYDRLAAPWPHQTSGCRWKASGLSKDCDLPRSNQLIINMLPRVSAKNSTVESTDYCAHLPRGAASPVPLHSIGSKRVR